jgi:hypothetical protein
LTTTSFPASRKNLKGRKCSNTEEATLAENGWLTAKPSEFFLDGLKKLEQQSLMELKRDYSMHSKYIFSIPHLIFFIKPKTYTSQHLTKFLGMD